MGVANNWLPSRQSRKAAAANHGGRRRSAKSIDLANRQESQGGAGGRVSRRPGWIFFIFKASEFTWAGLKGAAGVVRCRRQRG